MHSTHRIFQRQPLILLLSALLISGFFATTLSSYYVSKKVILDAIVAQELPLTSSNIYSEIQKDLVQPVLISSTMAHDTFVRDWVLGGERDAAAMTRYLNEIKGRYGAFSSFFVSDRTARYYTGEGVLKQVSPGEARDAWYYRVREMQEPYEINVDPDLANRDALTIFVNYRVFDFDGAFLGATGVGLTVDAVRRLIADYQQRFQRTIYFVDAGGKTVLFGNESGRAETDLRATDGLRNLIDRILREKSRLLSVPRRWPRLPAQRELHSRTQVVSVRGKRGRRGARRHPHNPLHQSCGLPRHHRAGAVSHPCRTRGAISIASRNWPPPTSSPDCSIARPSASSSTRPSPITGATPAPFPS